MYPSLGVVSHDGFWNQLHKATPVPVTSCSSLERNQRDPEPFHDGHIPDERFLMPLPFTKCVYMHNYTCLIAFNECSTILAIILQVSSKKEIHTIPIHKQATADIIISMFEQSKTI